MKSYVHGVSTCAAMSCLQSVAMIGENTKKNPSLQTTEEPCGIVVLDGTF